jgi:hypothetical protein
VESSTLVIHVTVQPRPRNEDRQNLTYYYRYQPHYEYLQRAPGLIYMSTTARRGMMVSQSTDPPNRTSLLLPRNEATYGPSDKLSHYQYAGGLLAGIDLCPS